MTASIVKELISKVKKTEEIADSEKAELLYLFRMVFPKECEPFDDKIDELIENYE